jgi:hypothetical protein
MWDAIKALLSQKKFIAALIAGAAWAAGRIGWNIDPAQMTAAITPLLAYIIAQGVADHGKGAAEVKAEADAAAAAPPK